MGKENKLLLPLLLLFYLSFLSAVAFAYKGHPKMGDPEREFEQCQQRCGEQKSQQQQCQQKCGEQYKEQQQQQHGFIRLNNEKNQCKNSCVDRDGCYFLPEPPSSFCYLACSEECSGKQIDEKSPYRECKGRCVEREHCGHRGRELGTKCIQDCAQRCKQEQKDGEE